MISMNSLRSLEALRVFESAARTGSFSRAAGELGVTHGAISRKIDTLEYDLGCTLFERSPRGTRLTRAGRLLFDATSRALEYISRCIERLRFGNEQQPFLISCERSIATTWLIPRLSLFQDENPGITVYLSTGGGLVDFRSSALDVAIRRADFAMDHSWAVEPFMKEYIGPVCKPKLQAQFAAGTLPRVHSTTRPEAWQTWLKLSGMKLPQSRDQYFDHFFLCFEAAVSGLGVAVLPYAVAADALADGRLVAPFGFAADGSDYVLISEADTHSDPRKARLLAWLRSVAPSPEGKAPELAAGRSAPKTPSRRVSSVKAR